MPILYLVETNEEGEFEGEEFNDWFPTKKKAFSYAKASSGTQHETGDYATATVWRVDLPATKLGFLLCATRYASIIRTQLGANKCTPVGHFHNGKNMIGTSRHQKLHEKYWRLVRDEERRESDPQGLLIEIRETEAKLRLEAAKLKRTATP